MKQSPFKNRTMANSLAMHVNDSVQQLFAKLCHFHRANVLLSNCTTLEDSIVSVYDDMSAKLYESRSKDLPHILSPSLPWCSGLSLACHAVLPFHDPSWPHDHNAHQLGHSVALVDVVVFVIAPTRWRVQNKVFIFSL
ncbi:unnamed protein product, partial [Urochloa humidicola]